MKVNVDGLGYREIKNLAKFMCEIAEVGVYEDVVKEFGYDRDRDLSFCITESGYRYDEDGYAYLVEGKK